MDWDNLDDYVVGAVAYDQWVSRTAPLRLLFFISYRDYRMRIEWRDRPLFRTRIATCYLHATSFRAPRLRIQVFAKPQAVGLTSPPRRIVRHR